MITECASFEIYSSLDVNYQNLDLSSSTYLITGAAGNLGASISHCLAKLGADLILVDHPNANFASISDIESEFKVNTKLIQCDLSSSQSRYELLSQVHQEFDGLSCLINNAAYVGTDQLDGWAVPFEDQSLEAWNLALEVNLTAPFHLSQSLSPLLSKSSNSSILNVSSIYGLLGPDWSLYEGTSMSNPAAYAASKGGLIQLTRWLATTMAPLVRVNAVAPGGIFRNQPQSFVDCYEARTPLKRMASEDDLLGAVLYLTTHMGSYVTGQVLSVDGGWGSW